MLLKQFDFFNMVRPLLVPLGVLIFDPVPPLNIFQSL